jgi:SAM-dependent methyltransferase
MIVVSVLLALLFLVDGLRLRRRAAALAVLEPSDAPVDGRHRFLVAPGVVVDEATRRAASAHARAEGLDALDLVPGRWSGLGALGLLALVDPARYRRDRIAMGRTAAHALLVDEALLERAGLANAAPTSALDLIRIAGRLKKYAPTSTDLAVAPGLAGRREDWEGRPAAVVEVIGQGGAELLLALEPIVFALFAAGIAANPAAGLVALWTFHAQPLLALGGGPVRCGDLLPVTLLRSAYEVLGWFGLLAFPRGAETAAAADAKRAEYEARFAGAGGFFLPRAARCPVCEGEDLAPHLRTTDLLQHKPGRFTLERCRGCGHVFQNPRLSLEGLDYYYGDFYDGLGERGLDFVFAHSDEPYLARARLVDGHLEPRRWLDVGCGHGHFCNVARDVWPDARFDGLDLSDAVDEAARRGWVDRAHRGLLPALAPSLAGAHDVVSMSHYLEHTLDQRAELRAAAEVLEPNGLLLIELPDPECATGRWLGRLWLPWFQPQHLHLVSVENLERLLREAGFEPLVWQRGECHQTVDVFFAVMLLLGALGPPPDQPWRPRPTPLSYVRRAVVWTLGLPLVALSRAADAALAPLLRRPGRSNTYRVLARKAR